MDLKLVEEECNSKFLNRWISFGASSLCLNLAEYVCEELKLSKNQKINLSTDDLAFMLSTKVLVDWQGLHDVDGNDIKFTQLAAFNAMANDLNFLNLVVEASFDRSKFV